MVSCTNQFPHQRDRFLPALTAPNEFDEFLRFDSLITSRFLRPLSKTTALPVARNKESSVEIEQRASLTFRVTAFRRQEAEALRQLNRRIESTPNRETQRIHTYTHTYIQGVTCGTHFGS